MLYFRNESKSFDYEIEDVIKLYFMPEEIIRLDGPWDQRPGAFLLCTLMEMDGQEMLGLQLTAEKFNESRQIPYDVELETGDREKLKQFKRKLKRLLFQILRDYTCKTIPWGIMTGIRPAKLVNEFLDEGLREDEILTVLKDKYFVTDKKAALLCRVAENQRGLFMHSRPNSISLYIGIPFCPTRCLYCSFSSSTIGQYKRVVDSYVDTLLKEIEQTAELIKECNFEIESVYIGGGTPTSLNEAQLGRLLQGIEQTLALDHLREYTLEAGRPDTINLEKLKIIKDSKITRISINPQTMNGETLDKIGRRHTPEETEAAFWLARENGFDNINMDLICGLPGENAEMFRYTLEKIGALQPDSLTVHTMAIKRASRLTQEREKFNLEDQYRQVAEMVDMAAEAADSMGLRPYYLYRQKNILGNLENVGYCKKGKESLYNIQIMEERQTILACGAGAVSKIVFVNGRIERAFNVKTVEEYIARVDEMVERKRVVTDY